MTGFIRTFATVLYAFIWTEILIYIYRLGLIDNEIGIIRQVLIFLFVVLASFLFSFLGSVSIIGNVNYQKYSVEGESIFLMMHSSFWVLVICSLLISLILWKPVFLTLLKSHSVPGLLNGILWDSKYPYIFEVPMYLTFMIILIFRRTFFSQIRFIEESPGVHTGW